MKKLLLQFIFALALFSSQNVYAQAGTNDPSFNSTDKGFGYGDWANDRILTSVIQSDGKIIIAGSMNLFNRKPTGYIIRLNADGSLDTTFSGGANSTISTCSIQSDGKIIIGGSFSSYGTLLNQRFLIRINADGSQDPSFAINSPPSGSAVFANSIQSDGKIIVGGNFSNFNNRKYIARLNTDGSMDPGFYSGTGANNSVWATAIQSDGKIIIGGEFTSYFGKSINRIARLNLNGTLDTTFNVGTGANNSIKLIKIQTDGKIIIGGSFTNVNGTVRNSIARLNSNGSIDTSFDPGTGTNNTLSSMEMQNNGKIIIGGSFTSYNSTNINRIARLNSDGTLDSNFNPGTGANGYTNSEINSTVIQSDGKIIIGGYFISYNGTNVHRLARLNPNGSLETIFYKGTGADNIIYSIAQQNDGKIIIGGEFINYNGISKTNLARLNADGSIDASFNNGIGPINNGGYQTDINAIAIQNDGKIIIGGGGQSFTNYNGSSRNGIARLNSDGSLDVSFNPGTGLKRNTYPGTVYAIAVQSDGKIIIGGDFTAYNGTPKSRIIRLNTDGSLDTGFNVGTGANVSSISIQTDGKIIICGGSGHARLNTNGSVDGTYTGAGANNLIYTHAVQSDGKIIIGGDFTAIQPPNPTRIARINTNGTMDANFNVGGTGANGIVRNVIIQNDGRIIISGYFSSVNGVNRNGIARLNANGSLDNSFNPGTGPNGLILSTPNCFIWTMAKQNDGRIIIGGTFTSYDGTGRNRIARLLNTSVLSSSFTSPNDSICSGHDITFADQSYGSPSPTSWKWTFPGGAPATSTLQNPVITYNAPGNYNVKLVVTNSNGSDSVTKSNYITVTNCAQTSAFTSLNNNICTGNALRYEDLSGSATNWQWSFPGGTPSTSTLQNPIIVYNAPGTYSATLASDNFNALTKTNYVTVTNCTQGLDCWATVGTGTYTLPLAISAVESLCSDTVNNILYAGGFFNKAGGTSANLIAKWNGASWSALGSGMNSGTVRALAMYNGELYAGGSFTQAGGVTCNYIAKWNGTSWSALGAGLWNTVYTIAVYNGELYVGGAFFDLYKWDGTNWSTVSTMESGVWALHVYKGELYAGGAFIKAGNVPCNYIAKWDGTNWSAVGNGTGEGTGCCGDVMAFAEYNGDLYLGGLFQKAGNYITPKIAKWDGVNLMPVGAGFDGGVYALANYNGGLYAAGIFSNTGGIISNYVAKWDGTNWYSIGGGTDSQLNALVVYNKKLIVGGTYVLKAGSANINNIASYDCSIISVEENEQMENIQLFPNPFSTSAIIQINSIRSIKSATLKVYDIVGKKVRSMEQINSNEIIFNRENLQPGIYFYQITMDNKIIGSGKLCVE